MMTHNEWISETKRGIFKPRSKKLEAVDTAFFNYQNARDTLRRQFLIDTLDEWLTSKDKTTAGTQRATAWKKSTRNSTKQDGKGTVERLLEDLLDSDPPLETKYKNLLLIYLPHRQSAMEGRQVGLDNIVQNLHDKSIVAMCKRPTEQGPKKGLLLSGPKKVTYNYIYINVTGRTMPQQATYKISFADADQVNDGNAKYIPFQDGHTTLADMDLAHPVLVSGGFSGCAYKLYKGDNKIIGAHIYRGGQNSEENVDLMAAYAQENNWEELLHIPTKGIAGKNGIDSVITVSEMVGGSVKSIILKMSSGATIVDTSQIYTTRTV